MRLDVGLASSDLGSLDRTHLLRPALRRLDLLHRSQLVRCEAGHSDVVVALQHNLDVAQL